MKKGHPICKNKSLLYHYQTMHRLYTRDKGKFLPIGWICHNCKKVIQDWEITEFLEKNKKDIDLWRVEINEIVFFRARNYLKS